MSKKLKKMKKKIKLMHERMVVLADAVEELLGEAIENKKEIVIIKVGDETFRPTPADLDRIRKQFEDAAGGEDNKVFVPNYVEVEKITM